MPAKKRSYKRSLQWISVALISFSALPCVLVYVLTPSVIQYAIETGGNVGLQIFFPLCSASLITGLGLLLLVISLLMKDDEPQVSEQN